MISLIIYARDRENDVMDTFTAVREACHSSGISDYEVIFVSDRSVDSTLELMQFLSRDTKNVYVCETKILFGINEAILLGLSKSKGDIVFPIPGHNMFDAEAIATVLKNSEINRIVLGYRDNLFHARPPLKFLSSRLLLAIYKLFVFSDLKDIHGLNSYPKELIVKAQTYKLGHGFHMIPLTLARFSDFEIYQIGINVSLDHKSRPSKKLKDNWPSIKSAFAVVKQIFICSQIKKNLTAK